MTLFGIFVGGRASRMQGRAKGLLPAPDGGEPLVGRLARIASELGCKPVLVGSDPRYTAALADLDVLVDRSDVAGPLAGLASLLDAAEGGDALALACDLPYVTRELLTRLVHEQPAVAVLAPRSQNGLWEPLSARYRAELVAPALAAALSRGVRSFQALFREVAPTELRLDASERDQLRDWDRPEDIER